MDVAYDHIQEETFPADNDNRRQQRQPPNPASDGTAPTTNDGDNQHHQPSINQEFQEAYKAFSASPWGVKLGGFWASARKTGEEYYASATHEVGGLAERVRSGTITSASGGGEAGGTTTAAGEGVAQEKKATTTTVQEKAVEGEAESEGGVQHPSRPDSLPADIYKEASTTASGLASRFRAEAQRRLKEAQRLEDAADEALLAWGTSLGAFLKDAVTIAPPSAEEVDAGRGGEVLFATKDGEGKRVVHASRLEAQLHVIHCSMESFLRDPKSEEWDSWKGGFDVEERTEEIARDLDRYGQLRTAMEKLVPEQVEYREFWGRYYFLRHVVETEEARRRELVKGATADTQEEVAWDDESDDDDDQEAAATPKNGQSATSTSTTAPATTTTAPSTAPPPQPSKAPKDDSDNATLKPVAEPRKSNEHSSSAGSEASYDLVSGATSRTPGSPTGASTGAGAGPKKQDDSDEEDDWE